METMSSFSYIFSDHFTTAYHFCAEDNQDSLQMLSSRENLLIEHPSMFVCPNVNEDDTASSQNNDTAAPTAVVHKHKGQDEYAFILLVSIVKTQILFYPGRKTNLLVLINLPLSIGLQSPLYSTAPLSASTTKVKISLGGAISTKKSKQNMQILIYRQIETKQQTDKIIYQALRSGVQNTVEALEMPPM